MRKTATAGYACLLVSKLEMQRVCLRVRLHLMRLLVALPRCCTKLLRLLATPALPETFHEIVQLGVM